MRRTMIALGASMMLWSASAGCSPRVQVIPDPTIPHQVAKETEVEVWARRADGTMAPQKVRLLKGWWIAGPEIVDPPVVEAGP